MNAWQRGDLQWQTERPVAERGAQFELFSPLRDDLPAYTNATWHSIVPGTDVAAMLALAYVLIGGVAVGIVPMGGFALGALVLGRELAAFAPKGGRVGVLLPNVNGMAVTLFGLWFDGRIPVMLNFTGGLKNLRSACRTAELSTIITSRRFVDTARLEDVVAGLGEMCRIVYLEDIRKGIGTKEKIIGLVRSFFARSIAKRATRSADDPGVVLFTSGSEGEPKGVVLSHRNLLANAQQIAQPRSRAGIIAGGPELDRRLLDPVEQPGGELREGRIAAAQGLRLAQQREWLGYLQVRRQGADREPEVEVSLRRQDGHVQRQRERRKQASVAQRREPGPSRLASWRRPRRCRRR